MFLQLCSLLFINSITAEVDDLDVKHIADVVEKSFQAAWEYKLPENAQQHRAINQTLTHYGTYDYIIVGAGSAGAVLATRLSENDNLNILLIEAGGHHSTFSDMPFAMMHVQSSEFNWNFKTTPQKTSCLGMFEQRCRHARGKGLGGSSLINALMYVRGNKHDYDSWARAGNEGWSYDDVLPYFIKSENSQIQGDPGYHGKGGLLNVEYHKPDSPLLHAFIEASKELGRIVLDYNGKEQLGVARTQLNTKNGRRQSTGKAFLSTAENRKNLHVRTHSYAKKVLIDEKHNAHGVLFDYDGQAYSACAKKEVILSAGAFGSPHLLMLSGIGPAEVLEPLGIPLVSDIPVGQNLQDHPTYFVLYFTSNYSEPSLSLYENARNYLNGHGAFTIGANCQGLGFTRTKSARTPIGVPNIEFILITQNSTSDIFQRVFNYNDEVYNAYFPQINETVTFAFFMMLLHPKSFGSVKLQSGDPYEYPSIDTNFLADEFNEDIEELYEGIVEVTKMMDTEAFRALDAKLFYSVLPACSNYTYLSKEQWFCQIRQFTTHIFHPVGTCKMGPCPLTGGVVNKNLQVYGVRNLRVVDASIIPEATSGHINAPTIMIAEKIADQIKRN